MISRYAPYRRGTLFRQLCLSFGEVWAPLLSNTPAKKMTVNRLFSSRRRHIYSYLTPTAEHCLLSDHTVIIRKVAHLHCKKHKTLLPRWSCALSLVRFGRPPTPTTHTAPSVKILLHFPQARDENWPWRHRSTPSVHIYRYLRRRISHFAANFLDPARQLMTSS